eukprot:2857504-Heterocapsa_arctica.AAC.1
MCSTSKSLGGVPRGGGARQGPKRFLLSRASQLSNQGLAARRRIDRNLCSQSAATDVNNDD